MIELKKKTLDPRKKGQIVFYYIIKNIKINPILKKIKKKKIKLKKKSRKKMQKTQITN
jgi:hypothetical protein